MDRKLCEELFNLEYAIIWAVERCIEKSKDAEKQEASKYSVREHTPTGGQWEYFSQVDQV